MEQKYTVNLLNSNRGRLFSELGEKGESLLKLAEGHFPIPDGFILKTSAYLRYINNIKLDLFLEKYKQTIQDLTFEKAKTISKLIQDLFIVEEFPYEIENEIYALLTDMKKTSPVKDPLIAIRSSVSSLELKCKNYKGLHKTVLDVSTSMNCVIKAIVDCWSSIFSPEAMMFRKENHMSVLHYNIALVIQVMIPSQASGIVYSCNPLTHSYEHACLDCIAGLGEPLIHKEVNYDHYVLRKHDVNHQEWENLFIIDRQVTDQAYALYSNYPEPGTSRVDLLTKGSETALKDEQIYSVVQYAIDIENYYNSPMEIEFCIYNNSTYILQASELQGLIHIPPYMNPMNPVHDNTFRCLVNVSSILGYQHPFSCLSSTLIEYIYNLDSQILYNIDNYLYIDYHVLLKKPKTRKIFSLLYSYFYDDEVVQIIDSWYNYNYSLYEKTNINPVVPQYYKNKFYSSVKTCIPYFLCSTSADHLFEKIEDEYKTFNSELKQLYKRSNKLTLQQILNSNIIYTRVIPSFMPYVLYSLYKHNRLVKSLSKYDLKYYMIEALFGGLYMSKTETMIKDLVDLYIALLECDKSQNNTIINKLEEFVNHEKESDIYLFFDSLKNSSDETSQRLAEKWNKFISEYGYRGFNDINISNERYFNKPSLLLKELLYNNMDIGIIDRNMEYIKRCQTENYEKFSKKVSKKDKKKIMAQVPYCKILYYIHDLFTFLFAYYTYIIREKITSIGHLLIQNKQLENSNDIFSIPLQEILQCERNQYVLPNEYHAKLMKHKESYDYSSQLLSPKCIFSPYFSCLNISTKTSDESKFRSPLKIKGIAITPGVVDGIAIVITHDNYLDFRNLILEEDDILVIDYSDSSYTSLLYACKGIVVTNGCSISHAALIARDYNIPCIINAYQADQKIESGMHILLDCNKNIVEILQD